MYVILISLYLVYINLDYINCKYLVYINYLHIINIRK